MFARWREGDAKAGKQLVELHFTAVRDASS